MARRKVTTKSNIPLKSMGWLRNALSYSKHKDTVRASMRAYKSRTPQAARLLQGAKQRCAKSGVEFNLLPGDVVIPERCPVLDIPLLRNTSGRQGAWDYSPSLDRLDASRGYVRGNVAVISFKANRIKNSATRPEVLKVAEWMASMGL